MDCKKCGFEVALDELEILIIALYGLKQSPGFLQSLSDLLSAGNSNIYILETDLCVRLRAGSRLAVPRDLNSHNRISSVIGLDLGLDFGHGLFEILLYAHADKSSSY